MIARDTKRVQSIFDFIVSLLCAALLVVAVPIGICLLLGVSLADFVMRWTKPRREPRA